MQANRRQLFKLMGAAATASAVLPVVHASAEGTALKADNLAILYDTTKCVGCRACQMACKQWNKLPEDSHNRQSLPVEALGERLYDTPLGLTSDTWTLIKLHRAGAGGWHFFDMQCMHCTRATCVQVCPSGALTKDAKGYTAYDRDKCIGCGYCTQFCPFGVPHLDSLGTASGLLTGKAKAAKCTFCQDRVRAGIGGPACAERCPVGALVWGQRADLLAGAKARVSDLQAQGVADARLYGEFEAYGLHRLSILLDEPGQYGLPLHFGVLDVTNLWQRVVQPLALAGFGAAIVGDLVAWFIARKHIRMQEVD
jgi:formate dehydrogenase iron-sulfur subunit